MVHSRRLAVLLFVRKLLDEDPAVVFRATCGLGGATVMCWCPVEAWCHGDVWSDLGTVTTPAQIPPMLRTWEARLVAATDDNLKDVPGEKSPQADSRTAPGSSSEPPT